MTYAECFAGIGGWSLGLQASGWELKWQCENNEWCRRLLAERFGVPIYRDIRTICDESPPPVDALISSPPCQPFSFAGAQGGLADARHLYPAFIKLVRLLKPRWVLMEQVPNIFSIPGAFEQYITGLAALGYDVLWHRIPACAVGANHQRDRLWVVAYAGSQPCTRGIRAQSGGRKSEGDYKEGVRSASVFQPASVAGAPSILQAWSTQLPEPCLVTMDDGIPDCREWIEAYGNAVIPQIPYLLSQTINEIEK